MLFNASSDQQTQQAASQISAGLQELMKTTGYTTRPALNEIIRTYRGMTLPDQREGSSAVETYSPSDPTWTLDDSARRLLVARTYTVLAQELETTSFQVEPRGVA